MLYPLLSSFFCGQRLVSSVSVSSSVILVLVLGFCILEAVDPKLFVCLCIAVNLSLNSTLSLSFCHARLSQ